MQQYKTGSPMLGHDRISLTLNKLLKTSETLLAAFDKMNILPASWQASSSCWADVPADSGSAAVSADDATPGLRGGDKIHTELTIVLQQLSHDISHNENEHAVDTTFILSYST